MDVLRGAAIIAVVGIHTTWLYALGAGVHRTPGRAALVLHLLCGFGVPLFLALSAAGLALRYPHRMSLRDYVVFVRRRAVRLLPAYVFWSLVSLAVMRPEMLSSPVRVVRVLLNGSADAQFYYIPLVFQLYLLWPLFQPVARWTQRSIPNALVVALAGAALSYWWWQMSGWGWVPVGTPVPLPQWLLYAALGIAAAPYLSRVWHGMSARALAVGVLAVTLSAVLLVNNVTGMIERYPNEPSIILASMIFRPPQTLYIYTAIGLLTLVVASRSAPWLRALEWLGTHSYGIFLMHFLVIRALMQGGLSNELAANDSLPSLLGKTLFVWGATLLASASIVKIVSRSRALAPLVTNRA